MAEQFNQAPVALDTPDKIMEQSEAIQQIATVITGTTNNSGHAISVDEYFIADGAKYKASQTIDTGATWAGKCTSVSDHDLINALNSNLTTLSNKFKPFDGSGTTSSYGNINLSSAVPSSAKIIALSTKSTGGWYVLVPFRDNSGNWWAKCFEWNTGSWVIANAINISYEGVYCSI